MLEGSISVTVTVPLEGAFPTFVTIMVYVSPMSPWMKLPGWVFKMARSGAVVVNCASTPFVEPEALVAVRRK